MFDVISLGTATADVFLRSEGMQVEGTESEKNLCFRLGAKLEVNEIYFGYGGGGTNSAVTFGRRGLNTAVIVQVGDDNNGRKILADLQKENIDTGLINVHSGHTDYSTILWAPDGNRTILVYRGKTKLEVEDVPWDKLETKWFYVSSLEGNLDIINKLSNCQIANCKIMWNPGGRELKQKEKVIALLPKITVLNLNKEEMEELVDEDEKWEVSREVRVRSGEINGLLKKASRLPCEYIVITDDKRGAYLWDKKNATWWHCGIFEDSPRAETTGAGDAFGSGLATGFIRGLPLEDCLYLASANASSVVSKVGAKAGILTVEGLKNWDKSKLKIEKINGN